tara:strand:+ start:2589 stop:3047 length:459 start_codon:yes stop_codon:yes gene_type:complete
MANPMYGQNKADEHVDYQPKIVKIAINGGAAVTAVTHAAGDHGLSWANPEGEDIIVEAVILDVTTAATGSATFDIGVAADGTTGSDTLLDAVDVGSAAILATNGVNGGTNGKTFVPMTSTQYITGDASASIAGLVGNMWIKYFVPGKITKVS